MSWYKDQTFLETWKTNLSLQSKREFFCIEKECDNETSKLLGVDFELMTHPSDIHPTLFLGGGFKYLVLVISTYGKISKLTIFFQMGWFNHQLAPLRIDWARCAFR